MDKRVHARFFLVSKPEKGVTDFPDLLKKTHLLGLSDREVDVQQDVTVRLERLNETADYLDGEFCRIQKVNIPPQATKAGLTPTKLPNGGGFGHLAAFRYHKATRVLLLQRNIQSVTPIRISLYIATREQGAVFTFPPVLSEDALKRFTGKKARSFEVTFADLGDLDAIDTEHLSAAQGARMLAEAYAGMRVTVRVSVGKHKKKFLDPGKLLSDMAAIVDLPGVKKLKATSVVDGDDEVVNFLKEHMQAEDTLDLSDASPDDNYKVRSAFLSATFSGRINILKKMYK